MIPLDEQLKLLHLALSARRTATLKRLSVCDCGFPALNESIHLGTEYEVSQWTAVQGYSMICGGCGKDNPVAAVLCRRVGAPKETEGMMPAAIFIPTN